VTFQDVSLVEHQFRSIRKWLNALFGDPDLAIWIGRPEANFSRPCLVISPGDTSMIDRGRHLSEQEVPWTVEYLAPLGARWEAERAADKIMSKLQRVNLIPMYLHGWSHPPIQVVAASGGSIPAGEVSVRVTAVNAEGEESLPSEAEVVTVEEDGSLQVVLTSWPRWAGVAKEYRVFAGAAGAEKLVDSFSVPEDAVPGVPLIHTLLDVPAGVTNPPTSSVFFYRFMRVRSIGSRVLEHPETDGVWNATVTFTTNVLTSRFYSLARAIESITIEPEVV